MTLAEAIAGVPALSGGTSGDSPRYGMRRTMHRIALAIDVATLLDERARSICDALRAALLRLRLCVTVRDQGAIQAQSQ